MNADQPLQAGCVAIEGRGIVIIGPSGSGKSTLALMLIDRGAKLVGDDGIILTAGKHSLTASPHPNIAGKFEIRGIGLTDMPSVSAPVCLVLKLCNDPPRYIERAETTTLCGVSVPQIRFDATGPAAPIRAEWALSLYGLDL